MTTTAKVKAKADEEDEHATTGTDVASPDFSDAPRLMPLA